MGRTNLNSDEVEPYIGGLRGSPIISISEYKGTFYSIGVHIPEKSTMGDMGDMVRYHPFLLTEYPKPVRKAPSPYSIHLIRYSGGMYQTFNYQYKSIDAMFKYILEDISKTIVIGKAIY